MFVPVTKAKLGRFPKPNHIDVLPNCEDTVKVWYLALGTDFGVTVNLLI